MIENIELKKFPRTSGVYWIKDVDGTIIYVGSSKDLYKRMTLHRSQIKNYPNVDCQSKLYQYLQENYFEVELQLEENFLQLEQQLIEKYNPKFNCRKAYTGCGSAKEYSKQYYEFHRDERKQHSKEYYKSHKEEKKKYRKQYSEIHKEELEQYQKHYYESHKEEMKQYYNQCNNQLCNYNGEILTLGALKTRFQKAGIPHSTLEAKKYLIVNN